MTATHQVTFSTPDGPRVATAIDGVRILSDVPPSPAAIEALSELAHVVKKRYQASTADMLAANGDKGLFHLVLQLLLQGKTSPSLEKLVTEANGLLADARRLADNPAAATPAINPEAIRLGQALRDAPGLVESLNGVTDLTALTPTMARRVAGAYPGFNFQKIQKEGM